MRSLSFIRERLLTQFVSEGAELSAINKLIKMFTQNRENIEEYPLSQEMVSAYSLYFLGTNYAKWQACMDRLPKTFLSQLLSTDIIEIGTGPGTFPLAFFDWLQDTGFKFDHLWYGIDSSDHMIDQAHKMVEDKRCRLSKQVPADVKGATLFFSHSLNEMEPEYFWELVEKLEPSNIIWIEPGTKEFFNKIIPIREKLLGSYEVVTPCQQPMSCPASKIEGEWCHQILEVRHHPSVERMCQQLKRDRRCMPVSFHVYTNKSVAVSEVLSARIFQVLRETKFSFAWRVCLEVDGELKLLEFEVMKKTYSKSEKKLLERLCAGESVEYRLVKALSEKKWRVEVIIA